MFKNFKDFLNENENKGDIKKANFHREYDWTEIKEEGAYPPQLLKEIVKELKSMHLRMEDGRDLSAVFKEEEPGIRLTAKKQRKRWEDEMMGEVRYFFDWKGDAWDGGYEEDVFDGGGGTQGGDNDDNENYSISTRTDKFMSLEEFLGCLYSQEILSDSQLEHLVDLISQLKVKYHGAIKGSKFNL